ncbi:MAG: SPOR domain-containing protein [Spirochaetales bacterium]|nr:SPOR domain-containing protein [Spirochaetales bacterium]
MRGKRQLFIFIIDYVHRKSLFYYIAAGIVFFLFLSGHLYGEQTWQGNAAMIRRGEFETEGFFAASNSFPLNTKILVKNLHNTRTTEVIVVKRLSEYYSVFLLLSEQAAFELGMSEDSVINVEVTVLNFGTGDAIGLPDDLPYNPDPDVFPLPTVEGGVTPGPTPIPAETPSPGMTDAITPEPTAVPSPGETFEPTPETSETPGPEPTLELTPEPTPEQLESELDRDPQKNLFLPPREDEMYVLEDFKKPDETGDEEEVPDLEIVSTDEFKGKAIDESITTPEAGDKDEDISSYELKHPEVEDPLIEDKTNPTAIVSGINIDDPAVPDIVEKEKPVPDPSNEVPEIATYDVALEPQEPTLPGEVTPDLSNEVPEPLEYDSDIALEPEEPDIPGKEDRGIPDPSNEIPDAKESDIALEPGEPDIPDSEKDIPDPSYDIPDSEKTEEIAMDPAEPEPPTEAEKGIPDPSYELPETEGETEIALNPEDPKLPKENGKEPDIEPDNGNKEPDYDEDIIIEFEETGPKPPTDADIHETELKEDIYKEDFEKGKYFIQLAAYTEKSPALALEKKYSAIYPVKVYAITDKLLDIYKVMVGPLNKYESDTLLYQFKSLGFKDAFVKYIN